MLAPLEWGQLLLEGKLSLSSARCSRVLIQKALGGAKLALLVACCYRPSQICLAHHLFQDCSTLDHLRVARFQEGLPSQLTHQPFRWRTSESEVSPDRSNILDFPIDL